MDIEPVRPKLCVECIKEKRFVEAHWDLVLMVGCPVHARWACSACGTCGQVLGVFRPGLMRCACGSVLQATEDECIDPAVLGILEIMRSCVLRLLPFADFGAGLPIADLQRLELRTLLRVVEIMSTCMRGSSGATEASVPKTTAREIVVGAAKVFADWPSNFHRMLHGVAERNKDRLRNRDIRESFAPFYSAVFKQKITSLPETLNFIKEAFLDFAINHWEERWIDRRTLKDISHKVDRRIFNISEVAQRMRIDRRTAVRHIAESASELIYRGKAMLVVAEVQTVANGQTRPILFNEREAAKEIQLPVRVLRSLKQSGDFEVKHQMPRQVGYRGEDVRAFRERLLQVAMGNAVAI